MPARRDAADARKGTESPRALRFPKRKVPCDPDRLPEKVLRVLCQKHAAVMIARAIIVDDDVGADL